MRRKLAGFQAIYNLIRAMVERENRLGTRNSSE